MYLPMYRCIKQCLLTCHVGSVSSETYSCYSYNIAFYVFKILYVETSLKLSRPAAC